MKPQLFGLGLALLLSTGTARADEPVLPRWDAGASFGFIFGDGWHPGEQDFGEPSVAYHLEIGRFLTAHLKTDAAVVLTQTRDDYEYTPISIPGIPFPYTFTQHERRFTAVVGAATYQFFENQMMHPFVSAGVQVGITRDHAYRGEQTNTSNRVSYTVPALDTRATDVLVRPFVSVGAKSYFNERTYVKSELAVAVGPKGPAYTTLRLGFGVDF